MLKNTRLKAAIIAAGYTQCAFAGLLGIAKTTLNAKINGRASFTMDEAEHVCELLNIRSPAQRAALFFGEKSQ